MISKKLILRIKNSFGNSSSAVYIKDKDFRYHYVNQALLSHLQIEEEDLLFLSDQETYFAQYADAYNQHDLLAMQNKIYIQLDEIKTKKGEQLFAWTQKFPLKDDNEKIYGCFGLTQYLAAAAAWDLLKLRKNFNSNDFKLSFDINKLMGAYIETSLSNREMDVLHYYLRGLSAKAIAASLDISERTIIFHINNIKEKWQCYSKEAIFNVAFSKGLIKFSRGERTSSELNC